MTEESGKGIAGKAIGAVMIGSACAGILVDFQEAKTTLGELWPFLEAILPIVALAGAVGATAWFLIVCWPLVVWLWARSARQRLRRQEPLLCSVREALRNAMADLGAAPDAFSRIVEARIVLEEEFAIPCPGMLERDDDSDTIEEMFATWEAFVSVLLPRIRRGDVKTAKTALGDLDVPLKPLAAWGRQAAEKNEGA